MPVSADALSDVFTWPTAPGSSRKVICCASRRGMTNACQEAASVSVQHKRRPEPQRPAPQPPRRAPQTDGSGAKAPLTDHVAVSPGQV
jgi:hypothetical protein